MAPHGSNSIVWRMLIEHGARPAYPCRAFHPKLIAIDGSAPSISAPMLSAVRAQDSHSGVHFGGGGGGAAEAEAAFPVERRSILRCVGKHSCVRRRKWWPDSIVLPPLFAPHCSHTGIPVEVPFIFGTELAGSDAEIVRYGVVLEPCLNFHKARYFWDTLVLSLALAYESTEDNRYADRALRLMSRAAEAHDHYILHFLKGSSPFMSAQVHRLTKPLRRDCMLP
eukprot:SAG31_NODE_107_length_24865_cov_17.973593_16_plen_224_part_00